MQERNKYLLSIRLLFKKTYGLFFCVAFVLSAFSSSYINWGVFYYWKKLYIYMSFFLILCSFFIVSVNRVFINKRLLFFILFIIFSQFIAIFISQVNLGWNGFDFFRKYISFFVFFVNVFVFHYYPSRVFVSQFGKYEAYSKFTKLILITSACFVFPSIVQILYIKFGVFEGFIDFFSKYLEVRWESFSDDLSIHRFYSIDGSYVKTNLRVNGLAEEASENAIIIVLLLAPFLLSRFFVSLKFSREGSITYGVGILLFIYFLLLIKSTLAIVFSVLIFSIFLYYIFLFSGHFVRFLLLIFSLFSLFSFIYIAMDDFYIKKIFDLSVNSTNSRYAVLWAMLMLSFSRPLIGVGRSEISNFIENWLPVWSFNNTEIEIFKEIGVFPQLTVWLGIAAEYGFVVLLFVVFFLLKFLKKNKYKKNNNNSFRDLLIEKNVQIFFLFFIFSLFFNVIWYKSILLLLLFLYSCIGLNSVIDNHELKK